jgi:hypothetical protein
VSTQAPSQETLGSVHSTVEGLPSSPLSEDFVQLALRNAVVAKTK